MNIANLNNIIRGYIYFILSVINKLFFFRLASNQVFILCYHSIASDTWRYGVSLKTFEKQLIYLKEKYQPLTLSDVENIIKNEKRITKPSFVLTFDDGYKDILLARKIVRKLGIKPTFFILSDAEHANMTELGTSRAFLSRKDIATLLQDGWILGSHGATHADFWNLSEKAMQKEIKDSREILRKKYNVPVDYFAYPKGRYTKRTIQAVIDAGYHMALSMDDAYITRKTPLLLVPRVGVDRSHTLQEFRSIILSSSISFRACIKKLGGFTQ